MKTHVNPYSIDLIQHFESFYIFLSDLSAIANRQYSQGGMSWDFKYLHGTSHSAKLEDTYLYRLSDFDNPPDLNNHTHNLAKFIWRALGQPDYTPPYNLPMSEYKILEKEAISKNYAKATKIIDVFKASNCDKCFMAFDDSGGSMSFDSVALKGRNAIVHSAFWSID